MSYLRCPSCGVTFFDRNPLVDPDWCPRCATKRGRNVPLERFARLRGVAGSAGMPDEPAMGSETDAESESA